MVVGNRVLFVKASQGLDVGFRIGFERAPGDVIEVVHHVALAGFNPPMITNDAVNFGPTRCHTL
jgi:hypothetical protein